MHLVFFKAMMERGENIRKSKGGDLLWTALRNIDLSGNMPEDYWQEWNK
jgi:hypothetical protein